MLEIRDLGLTLFQMNEVDETDPALVDAWLAAAAAPEIRSPTGFFLKGLRTGQPPQGTSNERVHVVLQAERWMKTVGIFYVTEGQACGELFDRGGLLAHYPEDDELRGRMAHLWRISRPVGELVEREERERAARNAATYFAVREEGKDEPEAGQAGG